jgi:hypothetical protein
MPREAIAVAAQVTPQLVRDIREIIEYLIDIQGIEVTKHSPFVKRTVAWLQEAEREGKGK